MSGLDAGAGLALRLPPEALEAIAERAAALVLERLSDMSPIGEDRWLTSREAAEYLGLSLDALHRLTAAREVPFSQDTPGGRCYFLRSELDGWRRGGG